MDASANRQMQFILGFVAYLAALWFLWDTRLVYPLKIFVVFLHELSHGLAGILTGGSIERIVITPNQGGVCHCSGNAFVLYSSGYLGSLLWGVGMLSVAGTRRFWNQAALVSLGVIVGIVTLLYVHSAFGLTFGLLFGLALLGAAKHLSGEAQSMMLTILGLTSCLYAILDIKSDILDRPGIRSDARLLAELTGVPTLVWGVLWITIAVTVSVWLLRRSFLNTTP